MITNPNTILIKNNATNQEVYRNTVVSRQLRHTVPAGTLRNGIVYNVSIQVIDGNNDSSPFSDPIVVYCYTTPTFGFTNLVEDQIVSSSFFALNVAASGIKSKYANNSVVKRCCPSNIRFCVTPSFLKRPIVIGGTNSLLVNALIRPKTFVSVHTKFR